MANESITVADLQVVLSYKVKNSPIQNIRSTKKQLQELGNHSSGATKKVNSLFNSLKRIATYRLLRTALKLVVQSVKEGVNNLVLWDKAVQNTSKANETMSKLGATFMQLKNTLGASFMPILQVLTPAIIGMANAVGYAMNLVNQFVRALQGYGTYIKANAVNNYDYAKSLKAIKNQLLGFDELNVLKDNSGSGNGINTNDMFKEVGLGEGFGKLSAFAKEAKKVVDENLEEIKQAVSLAPLAVGAILALTGNFAVGIPLIIAGIGTTAASGVVNWGAIYEKVGGSLADLAGLIGTSLVGVGLFLAFSGQIPLGLGLLVAGLATVATAITVSDGTTDTREKLATLSAIVGEAFLALGAILFFSGAKPGLGIGLMLAGAAGLAAASTIGDGSVELKEKINSLTTLVSGSMLALGAILFFTGANPALGLGLMAAGGIGLATSVALNWDWYKAKVTQILDDVKTTVKDKFVDIKLAVQDKVEGTITVIKSKIEQVKSWFDNTWLGKLIGGAKKTFNVIVGSGDGNVNTFADGGIPAMGSMFVAGETGDPEFVGNVGGRTSVYNSDQLAGTLAMANEGVIDAIYQMASVVTNAIDRKPVPQVRIGDRDIFDATQRGARAIGGSLVQGV